MDLAGRVCVVTGASSGIGRQVALDLASQGAKLCLAARREDRLEALATELGGNDEGHTWQRADVSNRDDVRALVDHVERTYGACHVLVNNAGFGINRAFEGPASIDDVEKIMATNFLGAVYATGEFLSLLERSAPAHVVNVASMAGRVAGGSPSSY
ncbi:MAG: SDR family NAD(P)-dependent oxidoreductase, partial [Actinomycetota bacterium]